MNNVVIGNLRDFLYRQLGLQDNRLNMLETGGFNSYIGRKDGVQDGRLR